MEGHMTYLQRVHLATKVHLLKLKVYELKERISSGDFRSSFVCIPNNKASLRKSSFLYWLAEKIDPDPKKYEEDICTISFCRAVSIHGKIPYRVFVEIQH